MTGPLTYTLAEREAAHERLMADYAAWLRGPFRHAVEHTINLQTAAAISEAQRLSSSINTKPQERA